MDARWIFAKPWMAQPRPESPLDVACRTHVIEAIDVESRLRTAWRRRQGCRRNMGHDGPSVADGGHRVAVADAVAEVRNERRRRQ